MSNHGNLGASKNSVSEGEVDFPTVVFAKLVARVLKTLYSNILSTHGENAQSKCREAAKHIRDHYQNLAEDYARPSLDFRSLEERFSYVYMLCTGHASLVLTFLSTCKDKSDYWRNECSSIKKVMAFGGGPGTEVLAISEFMARNRNTSECKVPLSFRLIDLCRAWLYTWEDVVAEKSVQGDLELHTTYECYDVTEKDWIEAKMEGFNTFQLFTFVYFISALYHDKDGTDSTKALVNNVFELAPEGAFFLFVDNPNTMFVEPYNATLRELGAEQLYSTNFRHQHVKFLDYKDVNSELNAYKNILGERIRGGGKVAASLFRKPFK